MSTSIFTYACIAAASDSEKDENITRWLDLRIPGIAWFFCGYLLPVFPGDTILNYIFCLGSMLFFGYRDWDKIFINHIC